MENGLKVYNSFIKQIKDIIYRRQYEAMKKVNVELIQLYWEIGEEIERQQREQGWGMSVNFDFIEMGIKHSLTWSHYRLILRLSDKNAMQYYLTEASENNWSVRTLITFLYTFWCQPTFLILRLILSFGKIYFIPKRRNRKRKKRLIVAVAQGKIA